MEEEKQSERFKKLIKKGYANIYNLYGGIESWKETKN